MALNGALGLGLVARDARDAAAFCVAGVAQSHIHLRVQAWHSWQSVARLDLVWSPVTSVTSRGRCGEISHPPSFCVAGVAQSHWQAWHNRASTFVSRGRRCTISHPPSFCVAGVALMAFSRVLGFGLVARDARDAAAVCVAGVAQSHIHLGFAWQAWRNLTGRQGTTAHPLSFHVAGVAQSHIHSFRVAGVAFMARSGALGFGLVVTPRQFAWQVCHNLTSTFVLRGRQGTISLAGVAQPHIHRRFTWQAWYNLVSTFVSRGRRGTHGTQWRAWTWFGRP